jgi:hypothetical protein
VTDALWRGEPTGERHRGWTTTSGGSLDGLLATYGVFAAGFVMRPLGAMVFSGFGDAHGREVE